MKKYMLMLAVPALLASCGDPKVETPYDASGQWDMVIRTIEDGKRQDVQFTGMIGEPATIMMTDKSKGDFQLKIAPKTEFLPGNFQFGSGNTKTGIVRFSPGGREEPIYVVCTGEFNTENNSYVGECLPEDENGQVDTTFNGEDFVLTMTRR